jgi:hypothetical protein
MCDNCCQNDQMGQTCFRPERGQARLETYVPARAPDRTCARDACAAQRRISTRGRACKRRARRWSRQLVGANGRPGRGRTRLVRRLEPCTRAPASCVCACATHVRVRVRVHVCVRVCVRVHVRTCVCVPCARLCWCCKCLRCMSLHQWHAICTHTRPRAPDFARMCPRAQAKCWCDQGLCGPGVHDLDSGGPRGRPSRLRISM